MPPKHIDHIIAQTVTNNYRATADHYFLSTIVEFDHEDLEVVLDDCRILTPIFRARKVKFENCNFDDIEVRCEHAEFRNCNIRNLNVKHAEFKNCTYVNLDVEHSYFRKMEVDASRIQSKFVVCKDSKVTGDFSNHSTKTMGLKNCDVRDCKFGSIPVSFALSRIANVKCMLSNFNKCELSGSNHVDRCIVYDTLINDIMYTTNSFFKRCTMSCIVKNSDGTLIQCNVCNLVSIKSMMFNGELLPERTNELQNPVLAMIGISLALLVTLMLTHK